MAEAVCNAPASVWPKVSAAVLAGGPIKPVHGGLVARPDFRDFCDFPNGQRDATQAPLRVEVAYFLQDGNFCAAVRQHLLDREIVELRTQFRVSCRKIGCRCDRTGLAYSCK